MDYPLTLTHLIERAGTLFADEEIVSRLPDRTLHRYSYGDLRGRSWALAGGLRQAGLERGDRVATLMWNHYAHLEVYFGAPLAGGVFHTLNPRLHPDDIAYIIEHADDRFLIVDDVFLPVFDKLKDAVDLERVFVVPLTGEPIPEGLESYESLLASSPGDVELPDLDEHEAAGMCYTSGTTGHPKGVVYSHRALVLHTLASAMADTLGLRQADTLCPVVPMFHVNAWGLPFTATMVGMKQVHPGPYLDAESLLELYERERVTVTAGVPTIWFDVLRALENDPDGWELPEMRMIVGGSAVPESLIRGFDRHGQRVIQAWGMTETTPLGSVSHLKPKLHDLSLDQQYAYRARQGIPAPFVEIRIMTDEGLAPWDGEAVGELQVRGPWVASRYHDLPDERDKWTADGWFRTGDVAAIDPEGYIRITDRLKDLINSGGEWISSVDMENALMGHPDVEEAAVIAIPHSKWVERPLAVVVAKAEASPSEQSLRGYLQETFADWQTPDAFVFVDEIPRTSVGKFKKRALREQFRDWSWGDGS